MSEPTKPSETARLPLLSLEESKAAGERAGVVEQLAELNIFRMLLRRERTAKGVADLLLSLLYGGELDDRLRELVIMRIGWSTGSSYEWTQHWRVARDLDVDAADLLGVRSWQTSASFSELDRAVLSATDQAISGTRINDDTVAMLRAHLSENAVIELIAAIGCWSMVSTVLRNLDIPLEEGLEPWPPDGQTPDR